MIGNNLPELPKGWMWTRLGEISGLVKGKKPKKLGKKSTSLKIPYINIKAFENNIFDKFTDADGCPLCEPNDILIVWDGARCGLVGRGVGGAIGSTLAKLVYYELNPPYLFYFLQSKYEDINKRPKGVGIPHVNPDIFWNIHFPFSPLPEQRRIVAKIEELFTKLDAGVKALRKVKAQLKRYRQAVLKNAFEGKLTEEWREVHKDEIEPASVLLEWIKEERKKKTKGKYKELPFPDTSDLPELPEGWVWTRLGDLLRDVRYGTAKKCTHEVKGKPVLRIPNIINGNVDHSDLKYAQFSDEEVIQYSLDENDLLMIRSNGSLSLVGRTAIVSAKEKGYLFAGYLIRMRFFTHLTDPHFLNQVFDTLLMRVQIERKAKSTSGVNNINTDELSSLVMPLCPITEQKAIVSEIYRRFSITDEAEKVVDQNLRRAERLRQSILKRAFEGKLVPQNPSDEPAEKLLERIKAEKAKHEAERKKKKTAGSKKSRGKRRR